MNFLFTTEMVLSDKVVIKGIKMVIRNYAITPRRGIAQSAQGIAIGNRRCRLRPVRAKASLGILCPFRVNVTLPSTQGKALGMAFVDISSHFLDLCGQFIKNALLTPLKTNPIIKSSKKISPLCHTIQKFLRLIWQKNKTKTTPNNRTYY